MQLRYTTEALRSTEPEPALNISALAFRKLPDHVQGAGYLLLAAAGFSLMAMLIKLAGSTLHVTQIILVRQLVMITIMAPTMARDFPASVKTQRPFLQLARVAVALVAMTMGFTALINMPIADATAIGFAKSFFVTIFAIILLKETVGIRRWSATLVGFCGVLVMLQPGTDGFNHYGLYAAISAVAAGLVMVIIRLLSRTEKPATILIYQAFGVGIVMAIPGIYYWQPPTLTQWLILIAIGVTGYWSQMSNILAYKLGEASLLAPLEYTRLIYATLIGIAVFGDYPGKATILGAVIVVAASAYTIHRESKLKKQKQTN